MKRKKSIPQVFLDANIIIRSGKPPGGPEIKRVGDLVDAEMVGILTTDLTITEVEKKHADNDYEVIKHITRLHFRRLVEKAVGSKIADITKTELRDIFSKQYNNSVLDMFNSIKAVRLEIDDVKPAAVFTHYANRTGFFSGDGKKDQFPDAFIFECLKKVSSEKSPVIIVSDDGDFERPAALEAHVTVIKSLPELFRLLGYEMDAPPVEEFLTEKIDKLVELVDREVNDWGLVGDIDDSEIYDITVNEVEINKLSAFKPVKQGDSLLAIGRLMVMATVEYSHPDWDTATYDSEDQVLIPFRGSSRILVVNFQWGQA